MSDCPTPAKMAFATRSNALSCRKHTLAKKPDWGYYRAYECECGSWHLTSKKRGGQTEWTEEAA